jgi:predicted Zn-dependent protease
LTDSPISRFVAELMNECADKIDAGQLDDAQEIAETLVCDDPNNDIAIGLLGIIHGKRNAPGTAMVLQGQAVQTAKRMNREQAAHWMNFALNLKQTYHFQSSIAAFEQAIKLDESSDHTFANYSGLWVTMGEPGLAEVAARKAIELNPSNATAHLHLGMALLSQDRWLEAWPEMEWRKREKTTWSRPQYPLIEWDGGECDVLLVHGEQGLGDEVFYCSTLRYAKAKRIIVDLSTRCPFRPRSMDRSRNAWRMEPCHNRSLTISGRRRASMPSACRVSARWALFP